MKPTKSEIQSFQVMGIQDINVSDTAKMSPGDILTFIRVGTSAMSRYATTFVQPAVVQSVLSTTKVRLTTPIVADPYGNVRAAAKVVYVTKALWVFNEYGEWVCDWCAESGQF